MIARRQHRSQISRAVTELEIGAEDLEKTNSDIVDCFMMALPAVIEHVEEEEDCAEQDANPGKFWRQEKRCLTSRN